MKSIFIAAFISIISSPAYACSCIGWEGGLVSEFVSKYTSFWGVPIQSEIKPIGTDRPRLIVSYQIEVLEGYNRIVSQTTEVTSSIEDGGSCGIQLTIGTPQFLSAYKIQDGGLAVGSCVPLIPYKAIEDYLKSGVDSHVPRLDECLTKENEIKLDNTDCIVWKDSALETWMRQGQEDWLEYYRSWRENKLKALTPR